MEKVVDLSKVSILDNQEFTTKKGQTSLRLKLQVENMVFNGIVFGDNYTKEVKDFVKNKEKNLCAKAKIGQYKGEISLNIFGFSREK